jgi:hypothetical protein
MVISLFYSLVQVDILYDSRPYYRVIAGDIVKNLWFLWEFDNLSRVNQPRAIPNDQGSLAM